MFPLLQNFLWKSLCFYYKLLKEKFPESQYTININPKLEYIASLEVNDTTGIVKGNLDSANTKIKNDSIGETPNKSILNLKKEDDTGIIKPDTTNPGEENKLTQEEIDKLLRETETGDEK